MRLPTFRSATYAIALLLLATFSLAFVLERRAVFVPGETSDGHHLVEESCDSCHSPFEGVRDDRCADCHQAELANDIHPRALFDDPRWAADLQKIDVSRCVTCHREHHLADRGVTIRSDFCFVCHANVTEQESHRGFDPKTCGEAGCHNYHDGSVLHRELLTARQSEPALLDKAGVLARTLPVAGPSRQARPDPPAGLESPAAISEAWSQSAHADLGVTCASCHERSGVLVRRPGREVCQDCHGFQAETFLAGKHGLRTRAGLPALRPRDARLPMKSAAVAGPRELGCATCHDPHSVDTQAAATQACLACHDDRHTRNFAASPHARASVAGDRRPGPRSVTCATCHLPRVETGSGKDRRVAVSHNNSLTLDPPDRMAALVCSSCHGLEFSLASLLDDRLVETNFTGRPQGRLKSFTMLGASPAESGKGPTR
jgi:hypothetical protein